jgi:hypothetical protein
VTEEEHAQTRDQEGRESEQGKDRPKRKSTHFLETSRAGKVSGARTGNRGKAHTS